MDPSLQQLSVSLGLTVMQTLALMGNPAMPPPSAGNGLTSSWLAGSAATAVALWSAVMANGWAVSPAAMSTAPLVYMSTNAPGPYVTQALSDPLFDS